MLIIFCQDITTFLDFDKPTPCMFLTEDATWWCIETIFSTKNSLCCLRISGKVEPGDKTTSKEASLDYQITLFDTNGSPVQFLPGRKIYAAFHQYLVEKCKPQLSKTNCSNEQLVTKQEQLW